MRGAGISTFLCGVLSRRPEIAVDGDGDDDDVKYVSLCKVGTGYSFEELNQLRKEVLQHGVPFNQRDPFPPHVEAWKFGKRADVPSMWLPKDKCFVAQLKCAEITQSTQFAAKYTCRFPRIVRIRTDKSPADALTLAELLEIVAQPHAKTCGDGESAGAGAASHRFRDFVAAPQKFRSRKKTVSGTAGSSGSQGDLALSQHSSQSQTMSSGLSSFKFNSSQHVEISTDVFKGMCFCVLESSDFVYYRGGTPYTRQEVSTI